MRKTAMTVGFADLSHFVRVTEIIGEEQALTMLQEAFKAAGNCILQKGGTIRKYIGDTILFTFEDTATARIVAKEIRACFLFKRGKICVQFNIGLATGEVWEVKIGHPDCIVDDIYGMTVNNAALLSREAFKSSNGIKMCSVTAGTVNKTGTK